MRKVKSKPASLSLENEAGRTDDISYGQQRSYDIDEIRDTLQKSELFRLQTYSGEQWVLVHFNLVIVALKTLGCQGTVHYRLDTSRATLCITTKGFVENGRREGT